MPAVSVVMSVYNGAQYLRDSVESILAQTFADFELIVVNDGSTDASGTILAEYQRRDHRVRVIDQQNQGLTLALIRGCREARGRYIARQDADDWSDAPRLARCAAMLDEYADLVMASCWTKYIDRVGDVVETVERPDDPRLATHALLFQRAGPPAHGSVLFRREAYQAVGGYRECFYYAQDSDLWLRLGAVGQIAYAPAYLYHARLDAETISGAFAQMQWEFGELGQRCHAARIQGENEQTFLEQATALRTQILRGEAASVGLRRRRAAANYRIGTSLSRRGNRRAKEYFWTAIRLNPLHWRSWCRFLLDCLCLRRSACRTESRNPHR